MKFSEFEYIHLEYSEIEAKYKGLIEELKACMDSKSFMAKFDEINEYRGHIMSMETLCSVRHTINTADEFYDKESNYWDETMPKLQELENAFSKAVLDCPFRSELSIPEIYFQLAENFLKTFDPIIIEDLQEENRLASEYGKLKASAKIEFNGEVHNLASITPLMNDPDRNIRKGAMEAYTNFFSENEDKFDDLYDKLVKVRDRMAKKLGYKNFTELGYLRMQRLDYNQDMVANYRKQVLEEIVPIVREINKRQAKRIGIDEMKCYDFGFEFSSGNPVPKGNIDELVECAKKMYSELSPVTGEFFNMMCENELFDLPTRPNKEMGGYCTDFFDQKVPFIFSNANGTAGDVETLTHEAGHALQSYLTMKEVNIPDITFPSMESCEIHSMSMEFFTHPWMELFFKEDCDKYLYHHIAGALSFLPYGVLVDHFQHEVYNHPEMTKEERKATWRNLEKMYKPDVNYDGFPVLERGGYFYRQGHIFESPFYYIDYTLAQVCALQFFTRILNNDEKAWEDYLHLCHLGGTMTFTKLVEEAGLICPFEDGCLKEVAKTMKKELDKIDDSKF